MKGVSNGITTLNSAVLSSLWSAVVSGELLPGSLHSVQALAAELGVSRTPVREALIKMAEQGMVRFERNRGVRILQPRSMIWRRSSSFGSYWRFQPPDGPAKSSMLRA